MEKKAKQRFAELEGKGQKILSNKIKYTVEEMDPHHIGRLIKVPHHKLSEPQALAWKTSVLSLVSSVMGEDSQYFQEITKCGNALSISLFERVLALFLAAKEDFDGGYYLINMRSLIQAEVFDDALEQAEELLKQGYRVPACVVVGVTLETTLKVLCDRNGLPHGKSVKFEEMNVALRKAGTYNLPMGTQLTAWYALRNDAAHGEDVDAAAVEDMLQGVRRFVAERL